MLALSAFAAFNAQAQVDTSGIYGERRDSLAATVVVGRQSGNYLAKGKDIRTEVITAAGLCKMACCNLAESFENSASVTVGYSDAVTGATPLSQFGYANDSIPGYWDLFIGNTGGSLGEVCALALLLGFAILLWRKVITWHIPVTIMLTVAALTGIMWLVNPVTYVDPLTHLLSGGLMLGAFFMATDYVPRPITTKGQYVYGIFLGDITNDCERTGMVRRGNWIPDRRDKTLRIIS